MKSRRTGYWTAIILIVSLVLMVFSMFASTDYAMRDQSITRHFFLLGLGMLLWLIGQVLVVRNEPLQVMRQMAWIDGGIGLVFILLTIAGKNQLQEVGREKYLISYGMIVLSCLISFIVLCCKKDFWVIKKKAGKKWVSDRKYILGLLIVCAVIAIIQSGSEPRWDGAYLFQYMDELNLANIFNLEALSFCDHISMSYTAINEIIRVIVDSLQLGMTIATIVLFLLSIYSIWGIIHLVLKDRKEWEYAFLTLCYAVSPFILGLSGYNYWDYWVVTMYPIVIYSAMKEQWIIHFFVAFLMCFVKEPVIVAYGAYCAGYMLVDYCKHKDLRYIAGQRKYWGMLTIGLIWLYTYKVLPHWNGVGGFEINGHYILKKAKVLFLLNFNWVLVILSVLAIIQILRKKEKSFEYIVPVLISDIFFIIFSITFETVNHARYIDTHIVALSLFAILGLAMISSEKIRYGLTGAVVIILIISNYGTLDPVTRLVFRKYDIGTTKMISTEDTEFLSDSMVYNQQYRYFDKALNLALGDVIGEDTVNYFPVINGRPWFFDGIYTSAESDKIQTEYWDRKIQKRVLKENPDCTSFEVCSVTNDSAISDLSKGEIGYYYYIPCAGQEIAEKLQKETEIQEEKEFFYRGFKVYRIKFYIN